MKREYLVYPFSEDVEDSEETVPEEMDSPEFVFEGFKIEFNEKVMLSPYQPAIEKKAKV